MKSVHEHIRASILQRLPSVANMPDLASLKKSEWSPKFERLRLNRLIMGAFRYGLLGAPGKPQYDRIDCMIRRLQKYRDDRNAEHLVDVANLAMLEFVEGTHNGVVSVDDGEHTQQKGTAKCK